jgi:hypothetical protein
MRSTGAPFPVAGNAIRDRLASASPVLGTVNAFHDPSFVIAEPENRVCAGHRHAMRTDQ